MTGDAEKSPGGFIGNRRGFAPLIREGVQITPPFPAEACRSRSAMVTPSRY